MVAAMAGRHETMGQDIVNHCVNDILVQGARPLFFMDYMAAEQLPEELVRQLVEGLATACKGAGCALIGGEMAELPGMYQPGQYDLVGFVAGVVERDRVISGERVRPGDVVIGLMSDGLHTNGYSLARKVLFDTAGLSVDDQMPESNHTVGEELLRVHRCYAPAVLPWLEEFDVRGMAHITGGGLPDNLIRCLPDRCRAAIIEKLGHVPDEDMYHTFNMGIGFALIVPESGAADAQARLAEGGETVVRLGVVERGERGVVLA
jgi:phosphoribosylformylglycinamidine cyclo-ligase